MTKKILRKIRNILEQILFDLFSLLPYKNTILFESEGDYSDNTFALYDYMRRNGYFEEKYRAVWLVAHPENSKDGCICVSKYSKYLNLTRLYYLATSRYYILDHCNVLRNMKSRRGQEIYNLFHGCTFKAKKGVIGEAKSPERFLTVTGDFWKHIMSEFIQCDESVVHVLGYPRNDYFFMDNKEILSKWDKLHNWNQFNKVILWMPTFRKSSNAILSEDYYQGATGLPILEKISDLVELNEILKAKNSLLVFKVHHLQSDYEAFKRHYSNIQILKDDDIISCGAQLYQIVTLADILITDYSSISNDYLLLNRPMIFTLDDYENYRGSRGFSIDDPALYFPGPHVFNKDELLAALKETITGKADMFKKQREDLLSVMHKYNDGDSSKRIVEFIGL